MGVMRDAFRLLFPRGRAWRLIHDDPLTIALGEALEAARLAARKIVAEANPGTATDTLPEWHAALGLQYDETLPLATQRERLENIRLSVGGMTRNQLQEQVTREFSGVIISEVSATSECGAAEAGVEQCAGVEGDYSPVYFDVSGELNNDAEAARVAAIIAHFAPLHLVPCSSMTILGLTATTESGLAICGIEECGNDGT